MPQGHLQPILIVDDVASEATTIVMMCRSLGIETLRTVCTAEAAAVLAHMRPAVIITDLVMPGADGLDCLFMIAENAPTVPVMAVTASEKRLLKAAAELGGNYGLGDLVCVAKPISTETLQDFVAHAGIPFKPPREGLH